MQNLQKHKHANLISLVKKNNEVPQENTAKIGQAGECTQKHIKQTSKQINEQLILHDTHENIQQNAKIDQAK